MTLPEWDVYMGQYNNINSPDYQGVDSRFIEYTIHFNMLWSALKLAPVVPFIKRIPEHTTQPYDVCFLYIFSVNRLLLIKSYWLGFVIAFLV